MTQRYLRFPALVPEQSPTAQVAFFISTAAQIARVARIDRLVRDEEGLPAGFQRPQIAAHIREIGDYLASENAILANPIVLGFVAGAKIKRAAAGHELVIDLSRGAPGMIVDGQQRFSALMEIGRTDFQVPVSAFICNSDEELHRQFILINNTKPLPKGLIFELLPGVSGLPYRYSSRSEAARLVGLLNYRKGSSLKGMVQAQTNPHGMIRDTILQKLLMYSLSDGALRLYRDDAKALDSRGVSLVSEFFHAVRHVYRDAWDGQSPKTSRLVHGVGITALGFVMEYLHSAIGASKREDFVGPLTALRSYTAWTDGEWVIGPERRRWNSLQNVSADWKLLAYHLVDKTKFILKNTPVDGHRVRR